MVDVTAEVIRLAVTIALSVTLLAVSLVDLRSFRIPDAFSLPLITAGLVLAWAAPSVLGREIWFPDHLIGAAAAFGLFAGLGEAIHRRTGQEALGLGDAKLFAAAGAWLGWQHLPSVLLIASLGGLAFAVIVNRGQRTSVVAFGPWIALGFMVMWLHVTFR